MLLRGAGGWCRQVNMGTSAPAGANVGGGSYRSVMPRFQLRFLDRARLPGLRLVWCSKHTRRGLEGPVPPRLDAITAETISPSVATGVVLDKANVLMRLSP